MTTKHSSHQFGAFMPDFIRIVLATAGIEPTKCEILFDDWSRILASCLLVLGWHIALMPA